MKPPLFVAPAVGKKLRQIRERVGARQHDLARAARAFGLKWTSSTVAAIESGRRDISLDEFASLAHILHELTGEEHLVELRLSHVGTGVNLIIDGELIIDDRHYVHGSPWTRASNAGIEANQRALRVWPEAQRSDLEAAHVAAAGDVEQKVARRLKVDALSVALAAQRLWKRSLTEERDRRLAEAGHDDNDRSRSVQTLRGHITRTLLAELGPAVQRPAKVPRRRKS